MNDCCALKKFSDEKAINHLFMILTTFCRIQEARSESSKLNQTIEEKDKEIYQLKERDQRAQDELKLRAEKIRAHEKMITELQQSKNNYLKQVQELEQKCERLEGEVNRVNTKVLNTSREFTDKEVSY